MSGQKRVPSVPPLLGRAVGGQRGGRGGERENRPCAVLQAPAVPGARLTLGAERSSREFSPRVAGPPGLRLPGQRAGLRPFLLGAASVVGGAAGGVGGVAAKG